MRSSKLIGGKSSAAMIKAGIRTSERMAVANLRSPEAGLVSGRSGSSYSKEDLPIYLFLHSAPLSGRGALDVNPLYWHVPIFSGRFASICRSDQASVLLQLFAARC